MAFSCLLIGATTRSEAQQPTAPPRQGFAPFAWARPASEVPPPPVGNDGQFSGAWAGNLPPAMPTLDAIRREVRSEIDQMPPIEPVSTPSWHRQYTLGPGDSLNFSMYDRPDLARQGVPIAPDGTISYLQAVGIKAVGRSIPELRRAVEQSLAQYHKSPRVIVTPATIGSKRFTIIGRVREPGSYQLDRPTSILEGLALAKGIEVGSVNGSNFELADLERSFVVRNGRKLDVDLANLYFQGNLKQNAYLEPNDYIFIASALKNEVYVLGSVNRPGRLKMATPLTVTRAITEAGGYNKQAYKGRVLLIRGSIHHPETTVVDIGDVLQGKAPDVPLQNRDIIFVDKRPFQMAERALDSAIFTFVQTVTTEVVNDEFLDISIPAQ
ncbi:MAG: polysaccharide biosynthesis/export family protein [Verrucomicrobiae bacterium]|nr:polysaccharide biosynthesis/export family protein [Verrucomicrobiae bacterium]